MVVPNVIVVNNTIKTVDSQSPDSIGIREITCDFRDEAPNLKKNKCWYFTKVFNDATLDYRIYHVQSYITTVNEKGHNVYKLIVKNSYVATLHPTVSIQFDKHNYLYLPLSKFCMHEISPGVLVHVDPRAFA